MTVVGYASCLGATIVVMLVSTTAIRVAAVCKGQSRCLSREVSLAREGLRGVAGVRPDGDRDGMKRIDDTRALSQHRGGDFPATEPREEALHLVHHGVPLSFGGSSGLKRMPGARRTQQQTAAGPP